MSKSNEKQPWDKIKNPEVRAWYERAYRYGSGTGRFTEIRWDTDQWRAWWSYFLDLGWIPVTLRMAHNTNTDELLLKNRSAEFNSWTAPCEWPSEFKNAAVR